MPSPNGLKVLSSRKVHKETRNNEERINRKKKKDQIKALIHNNETRSTPSQRDREYSDAVVTKPPG